MKHRNLCSVLLSIVSCGQNYNDKKESCGNEKFKLDEIENLVIIQQVGECLDEAKEFFSNQELNKSDALRFFDKYKGLAGALKVEDKDLLDLQDDNGRFILRAIYKMWDLDKVQTIKIPPVMPLINPQPVMPLPEGIQTEDVQEEQGLLLEKRTKYGTGIEARKNIWKYINYERDPWFQQLTRIIGGKGVSVEFLKKIMKCVEKEYKVHFRRDCKRCKPMLICTLSQVIPIYDLYGFLIKYHLIEEAPKES